MYIDFITLALDQLVNQAAKAFKSGGQLAVPMVLRTQGGGGAFAAAEALAAEGIEVEVIDPRTLLPLDLETILASVRRTNRLVVAYEAVPHCGFGAEIAAAVRLRRPGRADRARGAPFQPVPVSLLLEDAYLPGAADVRAAVLATLGRGNR
jgi:pyruvate dehydrogenase E1 component beta subunit